MTDISNYPGISDFIDTTDDYNSTTSEFIVGDTRYLLVTQVSELDAGQVLFEHTPGGWIYVDADNVIDPINRSTSRITAAAVACSAVNADRQASLHEYSASQVDKFSSANGPDGGNLACVWAVRHLIHDHLGYWVTRTDATAIFDQELRRCFGGTFQEADVEAGGIIISPTEPKPSGQGRNIGHVGLLGPRTGDESRLIYSNSSGAAKWKQNFTLGSWIKRYREKKGLKIRFYPLPHRGEALNS